MGQVLVVYDQIRPVLLVVLPLSVVFAVVLFTVRPRERGRGVTRARLIDWLLLYSSLAVAYLVLCPQHPSWERVRWQVGTDLLEALRAAPGDLLPWIQVGGNLVLLLPLGLLVPMRVHWFDGLGKIALGGLLLSCAIEVVQFFAVSGRVASADDVVLNTLSAAIGGSIVRGRARLKDARFGRSARPAPGIGSARGTGRAVGAGRPRVRGSGPLSSGPLSSTTVGDPATVRHASGRWTPGAPRAPRSRHDLPGANGTMGEPRTSEQALIRDPAPAQPRHAASGQARRGTSGRQHRAMPQFPRRGNSDRNTVWRLVARVAKERDEAVAARTKHVVAPAATSEVISGSTGSSRGTATGAHRAVGTRGRE